MNAARCGAVILAAGYARRMGSNKLIADLNGKPVIRHVADAIAQAGLPPPIVVAGDNRLAIEALLGEQVTGYVVADDHADGMGRSIAAGIAALPDEWEAVIVCLGDMPLLSPVLLRALAACAGPSAIVVPVRDRRRGNPVLWGRRHFPALQELSGDCGGRALFDQHRADIIDLPWEDETIFADIDDPAALERLRGQLRPRTGA